MLHAARAQGGELAGQCSVLVCECACVCVCVCLEDIFEVIPLLIASFVYPSFTVPSLSHSRSSPVPSPLSPPVLSLLSPLPLSLSLLSEPCSLRGSLPADLEP